MTLLLSRRLMLVLPWVLLDLDLIESTIYSCSKAWEKLQRCLCSGVQVCNRMLLKFNFNDIKLFPGHWMTSLQKKTITMKTFTWIVTERPWLWCNQGCLSLTFASNEVSRLEWQKQPQDNDVTVNILYASRSVVKYTQIDLIITITKIAGPQWQA